MNASVSPGMASSVYGRDQGISLWGHKPQDHTLGDQFAQLGNGVMSLFRNEYAPF
jgi:hypothetical protein